jgi:hypothetical protein
MEEIFSQITKKYIEVREFWGEEENTLITKYQHVAPITAVIIYFFIVFFLPKLIKDMNPIKAKSFTIVWNLFLSIFSGICFYFVSTELYYIFQNKEIGLKVLCDNELIFRNRTILFWCTVFAYSKYFELIDTVLLIIKKKQVNFLHWWHHFTVLLYTWYCIAFFNGSGSVFAMVNSFVHTIMYFYYFLTAIGIYPSWGYILTIIQILQMFFGIYILNFWYFEKDCTCKNRELLSLACFIMYGSYLILFVQFFFKKYVFKKNETKKIK